jgi:hypothetical protein
MVSGSNGPNMYHNDKQIFMYFFNIIDLLIVTENEHNFDVGIKNEYHNGS